MTALVTVKGPHAQPRPGLDARERLAAWQDEVAPLVDELDLWMHRERPAFFIITG